MESMWRFPLWVWWAVGIAVIAAIAAGIIFLIREQAPELPSGLVELRSSLATILEESQRIPDVDMQPLEELEAKRDYRGAVELMDRALAANQAHETAVGALVTVSGELSKLAVQVKPDSTGTKAIEAFGLLTQLVRAEKSFYERRRQIFEVTKNYYQELNAKKAASFPADLASLVDAANADLQKAEELRQKFGVAIKEFDEAAAGD